MNRLEVLVPQLGDGQLNSVEGTVAVDEVEDLLFAVVVVDGGGHFVERLEALFHDLLLVVGALREGVAGDVVLARDLGGLELGVVDAARGDVEPAAARALDDDVVGDVEAHDALDAEVELVHELRLLERAREPVEHPAAAALGHLHGVLDDVEDDLVGDELALVHDVLGLHAVGGLVLDGGAEHVAGGEVADAVALNDGGALGSLAGSGGTHDDNLHYFLIL